MHCLGNGSRTGKAIELPVETWDGIRQAGATPIGEIEAVVSELWRSPNSATRLRCDGCNRGAAKIARNGLRKRFNGNRTVKWLDTKRLGMFDFGGG